MGEQDPYRAWPVRDAAGTMCKMSSRWSWVMNALYISMSICYLGVSGGLVQSCGYIIPESPVLTLGSNFTALCILNESCLDFGNIRANQIIWKIKNSVVPKEQYRVINRTVSSVTFSDTSTLATPLTCNVLADGQIEQNIYGIAVTLGLPPEKPENLSCIVHQMSETKFIMTCTWNPGRDTFLATDFRLKSQWPLETLPDCEPQGVNNSCDISNVQFFVNLEVWVEAKNALGKAESEHIDFDPVDIVKPLPPHNLAVSSRELPTVLKLSWENQITVVVMELKFNIRYRISDSPDWMEVPPEDTASHRTSFTVQSLKPYTKYVFSLRCMKKNGLGYWSDWSEEKSGVTSEAKPSKGPPLWRKIGISHSPNSWTVHLIWKELDPSEANGIILKYEVTVRARPPLSCPPEKYSVNSTNLTLNLTNGTYDVTVTAHNRIGGSPPSVLLIPASNSKASVKDIKAFPKDGKLWVEWTAPDNSVVKYVIEWCMVSDSSDCSTEWQQELGTSQGTFLKGDIKPFKCYLITVHPLYTNGQGNGQSTKAYLQQGMPAKGPTVQTKKVGKAEAVLVWKPLSVDEQNGFIRYYTILYRTVSGNETAVNVDPSKTEYTLTPLSSDTLYMVKMEAHTDEGGTSGPVFTFTTQKFGKGEIEAIVVPVCLAFLLSILLGVLFCFNKRDLIKKHIWPNVPDPSKSNIAQWSPQTPTKHNFSSKAQMYPEGSFTDVSVVEIEADDKKSFSEQDLKPFNLLKKEKNTSEGHSSGIGGSSCMSSPRQSVSDSDESESAQNTSSTVQYSTVVLNGYRDQIPSVQIFSRSESTQPLLDSEEKPEDNPGGGENATPRQQYFKQNSSQDETNTDGSHFERAKQVTPPVNEEDLVGLAQLQISGHSSQLCGSGPERNKPESALADALSPSTEGQILRLETMGINTATVDEIPKSYMPQTVRQGGYMPQ
ncbi:interleukin-6 receptor subunit beta isoform X1 [Gopherus evgoodei]|uniref:Interleukin-6 receptor subunit beta n=2 Tax=Gopherus evgoodei TaxID=1825980 RepID=A0A8C4Y0A4_9SAUR|nr:interleukin-6 receptor subunit beta isoform X1 [Gopherus evgoodei]